MRFWLNLLWALLLAACLVPGKAFAQSLRRRMGQLLPPTAVAGVRRRSGALSQSLHGRGWGRGAHPRIARRGRLAWRDGRQPSRRLWQRAASILRSAPTGRKTIRSGRSRRRSSISRAATKSAKGCALPSKCSTSSTRRRATSTTTTARVSAANRPAGSTTFTRIPRSRHPPRQLHRRAVEIAVTWQWSREQPLCGPPRQPWSPCRPSLWSRLRSRRRGRLA